MPLSTEVQKEILDAAKGGKYEAAADLLVGSNKEKISYEEVLGVFKKIGATINPGAISNIYHIFSENSNNIPGLKEKLGHLVSSYSAEQATSVNPETIENSQIPDAIAALRRKQKEAILKSGKPNEQIANQLNSLINRQLALSNNGKEQPVKPSSAKRSVEESKNTSPKPGSKNWFVLPESTKTDGDIKVVTGSPIIQELRRRYEQKYSRVRDDIRKETKEMSVEVQFDRKKELDREWVFIESYKDSTAVEDQDIYAHQIASSFLTDKYVAVLPVVDLEDKTKKYYNFEGGKLVCTYNIDTKKYSLSIDGEISGAFSVLLQRKTDSGRVIDDAYDIVEFRDGLACMYAKSSKGNLAIRNIDDITRSVNQSKIDLSIPALSAIEDTTKKSQEEEVKAPEKTPDKPIEMQEPDKGAVVQEPPSPFGPPSDNSVSNKTVYSTPEQNSNAGYLRSQLQSFQSKPISETTMKYIARQLAEAEGKKFEDICKEFGITVPNVKKSKVQDVPVAVQQEVKEKKQAPIQIETQPVVIETQGVPDDLESRVTRLEQEVKKISSVIQSTEIASQEKPKEKKSKSKPKEKESPLKDTVTKLLSKNKVKPKKHKETSVDESSMKKIKARLSSAFDAKKKSTSLKPLTEQQNKRKR